MRAAIAFLFLLGIPGSGRIEVRAASPGRIDVSAQAAPLSQVLDRVSEQTGMKVPAPPPLSILVSAEIKDQTPVQAVLRILEGLGLSYAMRVDPAGNQVEALFLFPNQSAGNPARGGFIRTGGQAARTVPPEDDNSGDDDSPEPPPPPGTVAPVPPNILPPPPQPLPGFQPGMGPPSSLGGPPTSNPPAPSPMPGVSGPVSTLLPPFPNGSLVPAPSPSPSPVKP